MTNSPNIHWTQDAELLEQFVLHRLDAARRKELEAHLLTCEECQSTVRDEQRLVLGIKRVGRDEMKARLKERVQAGQSPPEQRTPWVRIVSIAATLVVLFGLGVYNKWIPLGDDTQQGTTEQELQGEAGALGKIDKAGQADDVQPPQPAERLATGETADRSRYDAKAAESFAQREEESKRKRAERDLHIAESPAPAAGAMAKKDEALIDGRQEMAALEGDIPRPQIWVDGIVITSKQSADALQQAAAQEALKEKRVLAAPQIRPEGVQQANTTAVTVTELPVEELPRSQQMKQQRLDANTVQTLIEQQDGYLNFTLYRNVSQQRQKTQNAMVEQVNADSIIIFIDGEQIGYKIRGGLDALQQTQQTKTKK
ncbi:MAG: zf-HC2 domain-containing protein [Ignavibacteriae bacterium]|nr:zf-HC2 domain-containing protein [Ignavibacteriota bacterium]